ncbi:hypothetical protein BOTBODRAFT_32478 [Botryobasidium botryosum FD-172 SS1]|uniref:Uncharacterized protein n=1 Tax=Botryobasidium botryosum (strain FD-172 SS1) TaxID=930990 RepID=A0A067MJ28_BOTB1|nr:hypothetical protein BOTBODRAFT_32478 [Botryobasidium botryosum FD-172 SS1]
MKLSVFTTIIGVASAFFPSVCAVMPTLEQVKGDIVAVTNLSKNLNEVANGIRFAGDVPRGAPKIANGLSGIIQAVTSALQHYPRSLAGEGNDDSEKHVASRSFAVISRDIDAALDGFPDDAAQQIVAVFVRLVQVHQALLATIIGDHGVIAQVPGPFLEPIRLALVSLEATIDRFALTVVALIPTRQPEGNRGRRMLDDSLAKAVETYSS